MGSQPAADSSQFNYSHLAGHQLHWRCSGVDCLAQGQHGSDF